MTSVTSGETLTLSEFDVHSRGIGEVSSVLLGFHATALSQWERGL